MIQETRIPVFVGLDCHQDSVQVAVMNEEGRLLGNRRCGNDAERIRACAESFGVVVRASIEACCGAADLAEELADQMGWHVDLAHPGYVARMKQNPDKSDFTDAQMLADLERVAYLPRVWLATEEVRELRLVVRYRQQLVDERRNVKLRIRAVLRTQRVRCSMGTPWSRPWMWWLKSTDELSTEGRWVIDRHVERLVQLDQQIATVEVHVSEMTAEDTIVARLRMFRGIGPVTAWMIRAEIGRFDRFRSGKQVARFCGLSPRNASSGNRQADAGLIKAGNNILRATLIEAAHRLIRWDPRWRAFAAKLSKAGKPGSVIAAAVANRWMRWLFHQMQPSAVAA